MVTAHCASNKRCVRLAKLNLKKNEDNCVNRIRNILLVFDNRMEIKYLESD